MRIRIKYDFMKLNGPATLYLVRSTRSYDVRPSVVKDNPGQALELLLSGCFWINTYQPRQLLKPRNFYSSAENPFRNGWYGFNIIVSLPENLRSAMNDITTRTERIFDFAKRGYDLPDYSTLAAIPRENKVYQRMFLPSLDRANELAEYAAIYGGSIGDENFKELHIGAKSQIERS
jgi:hypothetical protein